MRWRDYRDWWATYELSSLKDGQTCPEALLKEIGEDAVILSSARPRAMQTAGHLGRGREVKHDPMFNEAPLPPPKPRPFPMRPRVARKRRYSPMWWANWLTPKAS